MIRGTNSPAAALSLAGAVESSEGHTSWLNSNHQTDFLLTWFVRIGFTSTPAAAAVSEAVSQPGSRHFRFNRNGVVEQDEPLLFHLHPCESLKEC